MKKNNLIHEILLADDDADDCIFFKEALDELPVESTLTIVNNGVELMQYLLDAKPNNLPHVIFLDLNMQLKTGYECLTEIKHNKKLKHLPVVIFSTSFDYKIVNMLYENGAHYYIRKPSEFSNLKRIIHKAISLTSKLNPEQPEVEKFVLNEK